MPQPHDAPAAAGGDMAAWFAALPESAQRFLLDTLPAYHAALADADARGVQLDEDALTRALVAGVPPALKAEWIAHERERRRRADAPQ